jgi:iron(III) transport system substrate-binding protein
MKRSVSAAIVGMALLISSSLLGCGASGGSASQAGVASQKSVTLSTLIQMAKAEGKVTFYTAAAPTVYQAVAKAFSDRYGITVTVDPFTLATLRQRVQAEQQSDAVVGDVVLADPQSVNFFQTNKWLAPLSGTTIPAETGYSAADRTSVAALVGLQTIGLAYNKNMMSSPPTWQTLIEPQYQGKIVSSDPYQIYPWIAQLYTLYSSKAYGSPFLSALGRQKIKIATSLAATADVAAGQYAIQLFTTEAPVAALAHSGAPIGFTVPQPNTAVTQWVSVFAKAPHPWAAALFADFLMTAAGQQVLDAGGGTAVLNDVPGTEPQSKGYVSVDYQKSVAVEDQILTLLQLPLS